MFHLFSHGQSGELFINGQWLQPVAIVDFINQQKNIHIKHINIYGCEFAKGEKGTLAVNYISQQLGLSVAASNNITGINGDWNLEVGKATNAFQLSGYNYNLQCGAVPAPIFFPNTDATICSPGDGIIDVANTPSSDFQYSIDGGLNWQGSNLFPNLPPGTYIVRIRNADDFCESADVIRVLNGPPNVPNPNATITGNSNCVNPNGFISFSSPLPLTDYQFSIDGGNTFVLTSDFYNLLQGSYSLAVKQTTTGCLSNTVSVNLPDIHVNPAAPSSTSTSNSSCIIPDGDITIFSPAMFTGHIYSFDGGLNFQLGNSVSGLLGGTYTLQVKNTSTGCISNSSTEVVNNPLFIAKSGSANSTTSCATPNGTINVTGAIPGESYSIDGGITWITLPTNKFLGLAGGTYTLTTRDDATMCEKNNLTAIVVNTPAVTPNGGTSLASNCSSNTGTITVTTPVANESYSIDNGLSWVTLPISNFTGLAPGLYTLTTKHDPSGCIRNSATTLTISTVALTAKAGTANSATTCITPNGTITVTSAAIGESYSIDGGSTWIPFVSAGGTKFLNVSPGTYTLTTRVDATGCTRNHVTAITVGIPVFTAKAATTLSSYCNASTGTINVTGAVTGESYSVDGGTTWITFSVTSFPNVAPGNYTVMTRHNASGCIKTNTTNIIVNTATLTARSATQNPPTSCITPNGTLTVNGGIAGESFSIDAGTTWITFPSNQFTGLASGSYTLITRKDLTGCIKTNTTAINVGAPLAIPTPTTMLVGNNSCLSPNGSLNVTFPTPFTDYTYSIDGGYTFQVSNLFTNLTDGIYALILKNNVTGCTSAQYLKTIADNKILPTKPTVVVSPNTSCMLANGSLTITAPTGTVYTYSNDGNNTFQSSSFFSGLNPNTYLLSVKNTTSGCVSSFTSAIIISTTITPRAGTTNPSFCNSNTGTITVTSAVTGESYSIDGGTTWIPFVSATGTKFLTVTPGTYTLSTRLDATGCIRTHTLTLTVLTKTVVARAGTQTSATSCTSPNGTITVTSAAAGESYSIDGGTTWIPFVTATTTRFTGLMPGTYTLMTREDASGCVNTHVTAITVAVSPAVTPNGGTATNSDCSTNTGMITVTSAQNFESYSIDGGLTWLNYVNPTNTIFNNVAPGTYTLTTRDNNTGCSRDNVTAIVVSTIAVTPNTGTSNPSFCNANTGTITITTANAGESYSIDGGITWIPYVSGTGTKFFNVAPGTYTITTRLDATGCTRVHATTVTVLTQAVTPRAGTAIAVTSCTSPNGTITVTSAALGESYSIDGGTTWLPFVSVSGTKFLNVSAGTYTLITRVDATGCIQAHVTAITVAKPTFAANTGTKIDATSCSTPNGTITITTANAGESYSIDGGLTWTSFVSATGTKFTNVAPGSYTIITRHDVSGCTLTNATPVIVGGPAVTARAGIPNAPTNCTSPNGTITVGGASIGESYSIDGGLTWTAYVSPTNTKFTNLASGNYTLITRVDLTGCTKTNTVAVVVAPALTVVARTAISGLSCSSSLGSLMINPAIPGESYSIDGGLTWIAYTTPYTTGFTGLAFGSYTLLTRVDLSGCIGTTTIVTTVTNTAFQNPEPILGTCVNGNDLQFMLNLKNGSTSLSYNVSGASPNTGLYYTPSTFIIPTAADGTNKTIIITDVASTCSRTISITGHLPCNLPSVLCSNDSYEMGALGGPIGNGPSVLPQTINLQNNIDNPNANTFIVPNTPLAVTLSLSNQQYVNGVNGYSGYTGLTFGGSTASGSSPLYGICNQNGGALNTNLTAVSNTTGIGIDVNVNRGIGLFSFAGAQGILNRSLTDRHYYGNLHVSFNKLVNNPIINISGFVGFNGSPSGNTYFSQEFELISGETLTRLSGDANITLNSTNEIINNNISIHNTDGSFKINGSGISELIFKVYIKSSGSGVGWGTSTGDLTFVNITVPRDVVTPTVIAISSLGNDICAGQTTTLTALGATTYTWIGGATAQTQTVSPVTSTIYTVIGTNTLGCTNVNSPTTFTVNVNATPTISILSVSSNTVCNGTTVTINPSGAINYTIIPSGIAGSSLVITPTISTTYTVIGIDVNGCINSSTNSGVVPITVNATPTIGIASVSNPSVCSGNTTTITLSGANTYTLINTGATGNSFNVNPTTSTTYSIIGSSSTNCASGNEATTLITVYANPTVGIASVSNPSICSGNSSIITPNGASSYTLINTGATGTSFNVSPLTNTTYSIIGTSTDNCNSTNLAQTIIVVNATPTITALAGNSATICSGEIYTITPTGGGTGSYTLTNTGEVSSSVFTVSPVSNTTYTINGTNNTGCISKLSTDLEVALTVNSSPTVNAVFSSNALCSSQNVTITLSGANANYTLNPSSTTIPSGTGSIVITPPAGTTIYTITGNNTNGCVSTLSSQIYTTSVSIVTNPTITASAITNSICVGNTASITPFGATTYTLEPGGIVVNNGQTYTLNISSPTTYTINGEATGGCMSIPSTQFVTTIGINPHPTVTALSALSNTICTGLTTTLTASGASTYTWTGGPTANNYTVSPSTTTIYTVIGTSTDGCINALSPTTLTVNVINTLSLNTTSQQNVLCFGDATGSVTLTASGANGTTAIIPTVTNSLVAGNYTYTVTDALGCTNSNIVTITQPTSALTVLSAIETASNSNCNTFNGSAIVSLSGGTPTYNVVWSGGATGTNPTNLATGVNSFTVIDANSCLNSTGSLTITGVLGISSNISSQSSVSCFGGSNGTITFTTTGGGPDSYTLTNATTTITNSTGSFNSLTTSIYTMNVFGAGGCLATQLVSITQPTSAVNLSSSAITVGTINCFGGTTTVTANATGGTSPYTYTWSSNTSLINTALYNAGSYTVSVIDNNGCVASMPQTFTVTEPSSGITLNAINNNTINCNGGATTLTANVTGGTSPYTFVWQGNASVTNTVTYNAGTYSFVVTDANNCTLATQSVTVTEPASALNIMPLTLHPSCINQNTGAIEIVITGGTPNYNVLWSNGATSYSINNLPKGIITATVTDANNCMALFNAVITESICVTVSIPNFFTPEGDGKNELFVITGIEQYPNNNLQIFNRWGSLVYSKKGYDNSFDGKANVSSVKGTGLLPSATYFVILDFGDNEIPIYHGYLELKY